MGWFGKGIMDGDAPLDWMGAFMHILEAPEDARYDKPDPKLRVRIESRQHILAERVRRERDDQERNVGWQVLGVLIMAQGARMSNDVRGAIHVALVQDEWAKTELERKIYVREMSEIVDDYDGSTPTREYRDWTNKYGMELGDISDPPRSWKMLQFAMGALADHLKDKPWFKGMQFAVNRAGYRMLILVDEPPRQEDVTKILNDKDVPGELFQIPVSFYVNNQSTVMKSGDKIHD